MQMDLGMVIAFAAAGKAACMFTSVTHQILVWGTYQKDWQVSWSGHRRPSVSAGSSYCVREDDGGMMMMASV